MEKKYVVLVVILGVFVMLGGAFGVWRYTKLAREIATLKAQTVNPQVIAQQKVAELVAAVGKLMVLPAGEVPTVATVDDTSKLKDPFFSDAKKGDRVLLYTQARKVILYRPGENKIVEVSVVNVSSASAISSGTPAPTFILWNGTTTVGLTKTYTTSLVKKIPAGKVADTDNAKRKDYTSSILIDLTGKKPDEAKSFAALLGVSVSAMPAGEIKPTGADFLIILGADQK